MIAAETEATSVLITADNAVSMLAASALMDVLITRSALRASSLMAAETEASLTIARDRAAIEPTVEAPA